MSLLQYKDSFPWAVSIKNQVLSLSMPPWFADERYARSGIFLALGDRGRHHRRLVSRGAPEGERNDADAPPEPRAATESDRCSRFRRPSSSVRRWRKRATRRFSRPDFGGSGFYDRSSFGRSGRPWFARRSSSSFRKGRRRVPRSLPGLPVKEPRSGRRARRPGSGERLPLDSDSLQEDVARGRKGNSGRSEVALSFAAKAVPIESVVVGSSAVYSLPRDVEVLSVLPSIRMPGSSRFRRRPFSPTEPRVR